MIKVLIVEDSALIRGFIKKILEDVDDIKVVGEAANPFIALSLLEKIEVDVITLDIEMPRMSGIEFLEKIMEKNPIPTVMVSSLTKRGATETFRALELGAFDYIEKPLFENEKAYLDYKFKILTTLRAASKSKPKKLTRNVNVSGNDKRFQKTQKMLPSTKIVAIGSSTGGPEALMSIFEKLPNDMPGIVVAQHMPEKFTKTFANRLNANSSIIVKEAEDGDKILNGHAYISPGGLHLEVIKKGGVFYCKLTDNQKVNRHKPSVDVLFFSVAKNVGKRAMGIMLTGMGRDGANSMLIMKENGSYNIAQSENTCVVFGMPKAVKENGAVDKLVDLNKICNEINYFSKCL